MKREREEMANYNSLKCLVDYELEDLLSYLRMFPGEMLIETLKNNIRGEIKQRKTKERKGN